MALLKSGSTVGGNLIWHQGILPLFPTGDSIYHKNFKIYTEKDKPTNADVGLGNVTNDAQVKKSGDTMTGNLTITNNNANSDANLFLRESRLRGKPSGELLISANNQAIYLRPKGDAVPEQQLLLDTSGTVFADFYRMRQGQQGHADALTRKDYVDGKVTALENSTTNLANTKVAKAGDTMTGNLTVPVILLSSSSSAENSATRKGYVDEQDALRLLRTGGSMSGEITWNAKPNTTYAQYITSSSEKVDDSNAIRMFRNYRGGTLWHERVEQGRLAYYTGANPDRYIWSISTGGSMMVDTNYTFSKTIDGDRGGITGNIKGGAWSDWKTRPSMLDIKATDTNGASSIWKLRSHTGSTIAALSGFSTNGTSESATLQMRWGNAYIGYETSGRVKFSHNIDAMNEISMTNGQLFFSLKHTVANNPHIVTKISDASGYKTHKLQDASGTLMQWGDFGVGTEVAFHNVVANSTDWPFGSTGGGKMLSSATNESYQAVLCWTKGGPFRLSGRTSSATGVKGSFVEFYSTANTSKDANGFVRTGSKVAVTTDQITQSSGTSTTLIPSQNMVTTWFNDRYSKDESDGRYLRMNVTNKTSMPVVYRTANYFDDANQRDLNYAGFYRTNSLNSLPPLMIHIPHSSGLAHGRGIGFEYGSSGWALNTYAYDANGKFRGAKSIALSENHYTKGETYNRGEIDSRINTQALKSGIIHLPRVTATSNGEWPTARTAKKVINCPSVPYASLVVITGYVGALSEDFSSEIPRSAKIEAVTSGGVLVSNMSFRSNVEIHNKTITPGGNNFIVAMIDGERNGNAAQRYATCTVKVRIPANTNATITVNGFANFDTARYDRPKSLWYEGEATRIPEGGILS